jgi:hypothetical protein
MSPRSPRDHSHRLGSAPGPFQRPVLLVRLWRWRTEIVLAAVVATVTILVVTSLREGDWWPFLALTSTVSVPATTVSGRGWVRSHLRCLTSRHRIQQMCTETSLHTRTGRIPLIMRVTPTTTGERVVLMLRTGMCASDFRAHAEEIATACFARRATVARHPRWSNMIVIGIVRSGTETPAGLSCEFGPLYGETDMAPPRSARTTHPPARSSAQPSAGSPGEHRPPRSL